MTTSSRITPAIIAAACLSPASAAAEPQRAVDVSVGDEHSCVVTTCGDVHCWGNNSDGRAASRAYSGSLIKPVGEGAYTAVTTGHRHTCALRDNGQVRCWGDNSHNQLAVPYVSWFQPYTFVQIDAGTYHTCGITTDDELLCWGDDGDGRATPPSGSYKHVSAGWIHSCAVRSDGSEVVCWGNDRYGQSHNGSVSRAALPFVEDFERVSAGNSHTCALSDEDRLVCWGVGTYGQVDGEAVWGAANGSSLGGVLDPLQFEDALSGTVRRTVARGYLDVSAGAWGTCVAHRDPTIAAEPYHNDAACMGWRMGSGGAYEASSGHPVDISWGANHGCFVDAGGQVTCWGTSSYGLNTAPAFDPECPVPQGVPLPPPSFGLGG